MNGRSRPWIEPAAYAASALVAGCVALWASIPLQRTWGRWAVAPYAIGALLATELIRRNPPERIRAWLAVAVFAGAALLPLGIEAVRRSAGTDLGQHAQSEVLVTEEAARAALRGVDPYEADFSRGPLHARPPGTRTHFPYMPAMLLFGLPRGVDARSPVTDARVWFALGAAVAAALALSRPPPPDARRRRAAFLVLAVLPTGALLLATGGDDVPVLALVLLGLVLAQGRRPVASGIAAGLAAAMKQTAWPLLPFLLLAARDREGRPAAGRFGGAAAAVAVGVIGPFFAWGPAAFVEDAIRYPLGLGSQPTPAETPTLGRLIVRASGSHGRAASVLLVAVVIVVAVWLLLRTRSRTVARAAGNAGAVLLVAFVLAPAARFGYVVYPIELLTWAWCLRDGLPASKSIERAPGAGAATLDP